MLIRVVFTALVIFSLQSMQSAVKVIKVEMVADVVCPYCYIGLKHLNDAVQKAKDRKLAIDVQVTYSPFILRRQLPKEGVEKLEVFKEKFGGDERRARSMFDGIKRSASDAGLCVNLDGQRAGNSEDAHRLLLWARSFGKEMELFENMVKAYNCEQGWLGDHSVLASAAARSGLSEEEAKTVLSDSTSMLKDLEAGLQRSERLGVSGVPFFVVDEQKAVPGAVPSDNFLDLFQAIADDVRSEL
jgi:predicted DsbA family dithiol-disulfide isomerase